MAIRRTASFARPVASLAALLALLTGIVACGMLLACGSGSTHLASVVTSAATLSFATKSLPGGTAGLSYDQALAATGGTAPYIFSAASGSTLPDGLTLSATGMLKGIPTAIGMAQFTALVTDSSNPAQIATVSLSLAIAQALAPVVITTAALPGGVVGTAYPTQTLAATGGTAPYTFAVYRSILPAGLTLSTAGVIAGTPTAPGTAFTTVQVSDSSNPAMTATALLPITIASPLRVSTTSLLSALTGKLFTQAIKAAGGSAPYTFSLAATSPAIPAGLTLSASGVLSGTPTTAGTTVLAIQASDSSSPAQTATVMLSITVIDPVPALGITTVSLAQATIGTAYTQTIAATGGTPPYSFSLASGSATLPTAFTFNPATGVLSGAPTAAGTTTINVLVTDSGTPHQAANAVLTLTIIAPPPQPLTITTTTLPSGTAGTPYPLTALTAAGGTAPYSFSIVPGTYLPAGLQLNPANNSIFGTPTAAGTTSVSLQVSDNSRPANTATVVISITIAPAAALTITTASLPGGMVGSAYSGAVGATGGVSPYTFAIAVGGALPAGLTLNNDGTITGKPTASGTAAFSVTVTDSGTPAQSVTAAYTFTIAPAAALSITAGSLPNGIVGTRYSGSSLTSTVTGGVAPYTLSLIAGTLPAGLSLQNGAIVGTPTTAVVSDTFTIRVTDSGIPAQAATAQFTLTIAAAGAIQITTTTLPQAFVNTVYAQSIAVTGGNGAHTFSISAGSLPAGLTLDPASGIISGAPTASGTISFTAETTDSVSATATARLSITVAAADSTGNSLLNGTYFFNLSGLMPLTGSAANRSVQAGTLVADGSGNLTSGIFDYSDTNGNVYRSVTFTGTYTIGADHRGSIRISLPTDNKPISFTVALNSIQGTPAIASSGQILENDGNLPTGPNTSEGHFGSGTLSLVTAQPSGIAAGNWVFALSGATCPNCSGFGLQSEVSAAGILSFGATVSGSGDFATGSVTDNNVALSGNISFAAGANRGSVNINAAGASQTEVPQNFAFYLIDGTHAWMVTQDPSDNSILSGPLELQQTAPFTNASLSGSLVAWETQQDKIDAATPDSASDGSITLFAADGAGNLTGTTDQNNAGTFVTAQAIPSLTYAVAANGRVTLTGGYGGVNSTTPVIWLVSSDHGYGTEQPSAATDNPGLITIEGQSAGPFTTASISGSYSEGTAPAAVSPTSFTSGIFSVATAGSLTETLDFSVPGSTSSALPFTVTYTTATSGRGVAALSSGANSSTRILYVVSPTRAILLDQTAGDTAPVIQILQQ